ncbi:uncharacterized protein B0T23DRAFT_438940 [Neurospora hispaniola]|uniref:Transmembrane protein n=1 Tax=Neurospora hispaniola TaxID=588809 RepID=A0AAJ0MUD4_9PEZI|nr:hypothetical protein B0T23DRAFT_438940 [Neurospora hispaniola]
MNVGRESAGGHEGKGMPWWGRGGGRREEKRKEKEQVYERGQKNIEGEFAQFDNQLYHYSQSSVYVPLHPQQDQVRPFLPTLIFMITGTSVLIPLYLLVRHLNNLTTINKGVQQSECTPLPRVRLSLLLPIQPTTATSNPALGSESLQPAGAGNSKYCGTNENMNMMNLSSKCLGPFVNGMGRRRSGFGIVEAEKGEGRSWARREGLKFEGRTQDMDG